MNLKYRIRLENERVIGPFSDEEIGELFLKGHIVGTEMCQQFPIGDWKPLPLFSNLKDIIDNVHTKRPATVIAKKPEEPLPEPKEPTKVEPAKTQHEISGIRTFNEFKFGRGVNVEVNYAELEKKYQRENPDAPYADGMDKTIIIGQKPVRTTDELEKTVIVKPKIEHPKVETLKLNVREVLKTPIVELKEETLGPSYEELINEKTQFINLAHSLPKINAQLSVSEVELEKQAQIEEQQEKKRLRELQKAMMREQAIVDGEEESEVEVVEEFSTDKQDFEQKVVIKKKKKQGMSIIAILAFVGVFYFFLENDEAPKSAGVAYTDMKFPITAPVEDFSAASSALTQARTLYSQGVYRKRVDATNFYVASLQHKFSGNEAMGELILAYSELLDNTRDVHQSANTIYKFIQLSESLMLVDASAVAGTANFYGKIGKYQTGIYIVKNYLRAGNKPTPKMLTYYLDLLMEAGEFVEARTVYDVLSKIPKKPFESYYELSKFNLANDNPAQAKAALEEGMKYYPGSVLLLLQYSEVLLKEQAIKKYEETLLKVKAVEAESSPYFLSIYLKQMGYLAAYKNKNKDASLFFKKSLDLKESEELRSTLSKLEIGGDKVSQTLILESKVLGLLKRAQAEYKSRNIDSAFQFAIEAVDGNPDYIPAVLFLAKLNSDRGFFESAIYSLQKIIGVYQQNSQLKKTLVETYLAAYKFEDAERMLSEMAQTRFVSSPGYASLMGQFSEAKRNLLLAVKWYDRALTRDPLSDLDMYKAAKILVRSKRFPEARSRLSKALLLDPKNVNYHALYSEILYEQDGTDTAIGYLRDTISEIGEDPVLISAIATAYFKSGQIKEFQAAYKKVQNLPKKDEAFYEFLIAAAKLEGRKAEYIQYSRELLKLNAGNLKVRMDLGELLYEEKRYDEAIMEFTEIKDRLESYPKVHFQLARVYMAKNDLAKASEMASKELELNSNLDAAHFIMGEVHRQKKEYREAIVKYEKAISLNPKSVDALVAMASIRIAQNYANEALELLIRALREDLTNPMIHKLMGDAYRAAGQRAMAREKYEDYLKINPGAQDKDLIESLIRNLK